MESLSFKENSLPRWSMEIRFFINVERWRIGFQVDRIGFNSGWIFDCEKGVCENWKIGFDRVEDFSVVKDGSKLVQKSL